MSRWPRLIPAVIFAALLAGCGEAALDDPITLPGGPSYDNGGYATGGNVVETDDDGSETTTTTTASTDTTTSDGRNGGYAVGGN